MARENQKHLNLYIPNDLYTRVAQTGLTMTTAVILGLEKLLESPIDTNTPHENKPNSELVTSLQARIESLEEQTFVLEGGDVKLSHASMLLFLFCRLRSLLTLFLCIVFLVHTACLFYCFID